MTSSVIDSNPARAFLGRIFSGASGGHIVVWEKQSGRVQCLALNEIDAAAEWVAHVANGNDVYVGRGLQAKDVVGGSRGTAADVCFVGGLYVDADTREGNHADMSRPADLTETLELVREAGLPAPSLILHTGGGAHLHWMFSEPVMLGTDQARTEAAALSRAWQARLNAAYASRGYKLDATHDLARVVRIPGTLNHKQGRAVRLFSDDGPLLSTEEAQRIVATELCASKAVTTGAQPRPQQGGAVAQRLAAEAEAERAHGNTKPELASVVAGCSWLRHCDDDAASLSEPDWYAAASIVGRCRGGSEHFHALSAPHAGYSVSACEAKLQQAVDRSGPALCARIAEGFEGCARCPFLGTIASPISLGFQPDPLVRVQAHTVYAGEGRRYLDTQTARVWDHATYGDLVRAEVGPNPHDRLMKSKSTPKVVRLDYLPGDSRLIIPQPDGSLRANQWQRAGVEPAEGDAGPVLEFLEYFIPDAPSRAHLTAYLAHLMQRPAEKIEHGVILTGPFGTGKGTLNRIITTLFGERNARKVEGEELASSFNARWVDCQVMLIEEANHGERLEVFERTKELVTAQEISVHDKNLRRYSGRTPRGIFVATNHDNAFVLPAGDRRWFVAATATEKADATLFRNLHAALDKGSCVAAFAAYLHAFDISGFRARGEAPPMTVAKERATEASRTPLAGVIAELIEARTHCFGRDVVTGEDVANAAMRSSYYVGKATKTAVAAALKSLGCIRYEGLVRVNARSARLWAVRDVEKWKAAAPDAWRAEYLSAGTAGNESVLPPSITRLLGAAAA